MGVDKPEEETERLRTKDGRCELWGDLGFCSTFIHKITHGFAGLPVGEEAEVFQCCC